MSDDISIGHRKLVALGSRLKKTDIPIVTKLSKPGRNLLNVISFLNSCTEKSKNIFD